MPKTSSPDRPYGDCVRTEAPPPGTALRGVLAILGTLAVTFGVVAEVASGSPSTAIIVALTGLIVALAAIMWELRVGRRERYGR